MFRVSSLFRVLIVGSALAVAGCAGQFSEVTAQGPGAGVTASATGGPLQIVPVAAKPDTTANGDGFTMALGMYFF